MKKIKHTICIRVIADLLIALKKIIHIICYPTTHFYKIANNNNNSLKNILFLFFATFYPFQYILIVILLFTRPQAILGGLELLLFVNISSVCLIIVNYFLVNFVCKIIKNINIRHPFRRFLVNLRDEVVQKKLEK